MKKIKYLMICILIIICTGCVKYNVNMKINSDKSMNLEIVYAVEESLESSILNKTQIEKLKKEGYTLKNYNKDSYTGYVITKKIKNIDDKSTIQDNVADIDITNDTKYLFKIEKGFFKNTYTYIGKKIDNSAYVDSLDLSTIESSMEMKLTVSLPYGALKSNATDTDKDSKKLTWDMLNFKDERIYFKFELYNISNIIVSIVGTIILIIIIISIAKGKKKKDLYDGNFDIPKKSTT